ncbi:hypothetical protein AK812_SmicGene5252 [Symbiodinium microadriaticum]|uniref:Uncharacterized protein n=1 Tax=Symbiodinium microadriaticum TaxID=2951 RepID=A0A1Q9EU41_SYMMI|nr:hypothetical protein AK812_SmicGene5252 [Symbiodinium microadriaticum]
MEGVGGWRVGWAGGWRLEGGGDGGLVPEGVDEGRLVDGVWVEGWMEGGGLVAGGWWMEGGWRVDWCVDGGRLEAGRVGWWMEAGWRGGWRVVAEGVDGVAGWLDGGLDGGALEGLAGWRGWCGWSGGGREAVGGWRVGWRGWLWLEVHCYEGLRTKPMIVKLRLYSS